MPSPRPIQDCALLSRPPLLSFHYQKRDDRGLSLEFGLVSPPVHNHKTQSCLTPLRHPHLQTGESVFSRFFILNNIFMSNDACTPQSLKSTHADLQHHCRHRLRELCTSNGGSVVQNADTERKRIEGRTLLNVFDHGVGGLYCPRKLLAWSPGINATKIDWTRRGGGIWKNEPDLGGCSVWCLAG